MRQSGRNERFEELAMPLFGALYNYAHWLAGNREAAEDLVQETYAKALRGFSSFQPGTNFRAWIYRILRNAFLTSRTGLKAMVSYDAAAEDFPMTAAETPESALLARADSEAVQEALERLPAPFRETILLCDVEEMSYREISETLGIPVGTVMSRLARARKAMREMLAQKSRSAPQ